VSRLCGILIDPQDISKPRDEQRAAASLHLHRFFWFDRRKAAAVILPFLIAIQVLKSHSSKIRPLSPATCPELGVSNGWPH
jgi:hypothetical protein